MSKKISDKTLSDHLTDNERSKRFINGLLDETTGEITSTYGDAPWTDTVYPAKGSKGDYKKCAHDHPGLKIKTVDGKEFTVYGGACGDPVHKGLDIYVALDHSTSHDSAAYPWHGTRQFIYFPISDMSVPKDAAEFMLMVGWLAMQIEAGKRVHVGCLGGHGRTGMVLAALVKVISGNEDAIPYVREFYCQKAVETTAQAEWLHKHFGIKVTDGYKTKKYSDTKTGWGTVIQGTVTNIQPRRDARVNEIAKEFGTATEVKPFKVAGNVWGAVA